MSESAEIQNQKLRQKEKLLDEIIPFVSGNPEKIQQVLWTKPIPELEQILAEFKLHDTSIEAAQVRVAQARGEREAERILHQLRMKELHEPQRAKEAEKQLAKDKTTFVQACKQLRIGNNEANFNLIRQNLGEGFSIFQIREMHAANGGTLAPAKEKEVAQWTQEAQDQEVQRTQEELAQAVRQYDRGNPAPLRRIRDKERFKSQAANQQAEARQFESTVQRESNLNFPALPTQFQGQPLDAAFIKKASPETIRFLRKKYGPAQLDLRIRETA